MQFVSTAKNLTENFVKELEIQIWNNNLLTFQVTFFESFQLIVLRGGIRSREGVRGVAAAIPKFCLTNGRILYLLFLFLISATPEQNSQLPPCKLGTHQYCNLTKFGQDWTENKKKLAQGQKVVRTPFLKDVACRQIYFSIILLPLPLFYVVPMFNI